MSEQHCIGLQQKVRHKEEVCKRLDKGCELHEKLN